MSNDPVETPTELPSCYRSLQNAPDADVRSKLVSEFWAPEGIRNGTVRPRFQVAA
ncbi:hypothetical protein [Microbacterium sp.]|uniref:hypothetical protein n=1 Tax=Microbacterium sp. TaxID=51671 RepID=UPI00260DFFC3|nr:hypothetical protein [Microbacterium sp.]